MVWTLVSYSEIHVPLLPFKPGYVVGLAEDGNTQRLIVQVEIDGTRDQEISVGVTGEVKTVELAEGSVNVFMPFL
jgi:uncharacterized OB-fold protein